MKKIFIGIIIFLFTIINCNAFEKSNINLLLEGFHNNGYVIDCNMIFGDCELEKEGLLYKNEIVSNKKIDDINIIKKGEKNLNIYRGKYIKLINIYSYKSSQEITKKILEYGNYLGKGYKYFEKGGLKIVYKIEKAISTDKIKFISDKYYLDITIYYKNTVYNLKGIINDSLKEDLRTYFKLIKTLKTQKYFNFNKKYFVLYLGNTSTKRIFIDKKSELLIYDYGELKENEKSAITSIYKLFNSVNFPNKTQYYFKNYIIIANKILKQENINSIIKEIENYK